jgi:hypothetical protein
LAEDKDTFINGSIFEEPIEWLLDILGSNIDKVGWPKNVGRLIFLSMWERTRYYLLLYTGQSWKYNQHKKQGLKILKDIISMLWIGLKIK